MSDKTATQILSEKQAWDRFGHIPDDIKTEEDYLRWMLAQIQAQAHADAEPYVSRLVELEMRKPPKPIFIPLDQLPADMLARFNTKF